MLNLHISIQQWANLHWALASFSHPFRDFAAGALSFKESEDVIATSQKKKTHEVHISFAPTQFQMTSCARETCMWCEVLIISKNPQHSIIENYSKKCNSVCNCVSSHIHSRDMEKLMKPFCSLFLYCLLNNRHSFLFG